MATQEDKQTRTIKKILLVILLVGAALVILGLTFLKKDNGTAFNVKDVSLVESAKTSVAVSVDAKGDGLRYYYSLDGKNYIEGNSSYTFTGLKEGTTYTVYVKVVDKDGTEHYFRDGIEFQVMTKHNTQLEMGKVSNLITDMNIQGATPEEITRAARHSMVVYYLKNPFRTYF